MNMDPRSKLLNTEMGLVVDNPDLAKAVSDFFTTAILPANPYQLLRVNDSKSNGNHIVWSIMDKGVEKQVDDEPETTAPQRMKMRLMKLLPIDGLL